MADANWKSTNIPASVHEAIKKRHVPARATSVQNYVVFWTRIGLLVDELLAVDKNTSKLERILEAMASIRSRDVDEDEP